MRLHRPSSLLRIALLALSLGAVLPARAADCGPYRVGVREYPQVYQKQPGGRYTGLDAEFFEALAARSGCELKLELASLPQIWSRFKDGSLDLSSWVIPNEEREVLVHVIPLLRVHMMVVTWRDQGPAGQLEFMADPRRRAVAIRRASYGPGYDALLAQLREQGRVSEVGDFEAALRVFNAHRVDLMFAYPWTLAQQPLAWQEQILITDWQPGAPSLVSGLALSRGTVRDADLHRFERALREMQQDGSLAALVHRYLSQANAQMLPVPGKGED